MLDEFYVFSSFLIAEHIYFFLIAWKVLNAKLFSN